MFKVRISWATFPAWKYTNLLREQDEFGFKQITFCGKYAIYLFIFILKCGLTLNPSITNDREHHEENAINSLFLFSWTVIEIFLLYTHNVVFDVESCWPLITHFFFIHTTSPCFFSYKVKTHLRNCIYN